MSDLTDLPAACAFVVVYIVAAGIGTAVLWAVCILLSRWPR
jgi:hypothetical protein